MALLGVLATVLVLAPSTTSGVLADGGCGVKALALPLADGSRPCVHADEAPPGVDVTDPVSVAELRSRVGAGPAAYRAAEDLGVPAAVASTATSPAVTCDGDGTSGYRVQPMYVVEASKANRYAALLPQFRLWAAGVDDVFNRSAALTGGVRHVRYVTTAGAGGTCVADVLNVTVPDGSMASFGATISAVQALGYTDPHRKYLMWTEATSLCGIATLYNTDTPGQDNPNNGRYAQYARVDSGCWGLGNGSGDHSVEAHELSHNLGAVQNSAPHSTNAGHCWDEYDTMCYADGGNHAMVVVCPSAREYLLDCGSDDYYSTYPDPGGYLDEHWNAAQSRFLIGGGDGTGGGEPGAPTVLGARIGVNNPAVPGLSTQVSVTPALPTGRTLSSVTWTSKGKGCVFGTPTEVQSTVTCPATLTTATTVTATVVDSTGATKVVSSPLTFDQTGSRALAASLSLAGHSATDSGSASLCTGASTPISATLTDASSGQPVLGLSAAFTKKTATQTTAGSAGSAVTSGAGVATAKVSTTTPITFGVKTTATKTYAALAPLTVPAAVGTCAPTLTASASNLDVYAGDPVTVSGRLTRSVDGATLGVAYASLPVRLTSTTTTNGRTTTKVTTLGTAATDTDGRFSIAVSPTTSGALTVQLAGSAAYTATSTSLGDLTVTMPTTSLAGTAVDTADVGYGSAVTVTGTLRRTAGSSERGVAGQTVTAKVQPSTGAAVTLGTAKTQADGTFRVAAALRKSGTLTVSYAGSAVLPAASSTVGPVTAGTWDPEISATPSTTTTAAGQSVTVTGTLTRSYAGSDEPARSVPLKLAARAAGASTDTLSSATTSATGTFTIKVAPRVTTTYEVRLRSVAGYADATSTSFTVTVH